MTRSVVLNGASLTLAELDALAGGAPAQVAQDAWPRLDAARALVDKVTAGDAVVYGINTGFGNFASVRIPSGQLRALQHNLVVSHAAGLGHPLPRTVSRAMLALRINCVLKGHSGVRREVVDRLLLHLNERAEPVIPERGSVGASGDLAPLAHMALPLLGLGEVFGEDGRPEPAAAFLQRKGLAPLTLEAKEGLALINGTQAITAMLALGLASLRKTFLQLEGIAALTLEALLGSRRAFDPRVHAARTHPGQAASAERLRALLGNSSPIGESHADCGKVQDAYSLRCIPQVHGPFREAWRFAVGIAQREMNAATDNPLLFPEQGDTVSGGNFHGAYPGLACDLMRVSATDVMAMSERRLERMVNPSLSGLPAFLTRDGGLHSGLMIVQVSAASVVSEARTGAFPCTVDTIPTSAGQEDHVSMGTTSARRLLELTRWFTEVAACEWLAATEALEYRRPLRGSAAVEAAYADLRMDVPPLAGDVEMAPRMHAAARRLEQETLAAALEKAAPRLAEIENTHQGGLGNV